LLSQESPAALTLFSQGITPYLWGSAIVLLLSALLQPLKELRNGTAQQNHRFDFIIYFATALVSVGQAWGSVARLESMGLVDQLGQHLFSPSLLPIVISTAGTLLLVWIADNITQKGIVNGVALFVFVDIAFQLEPLVGSLSSASSAGVLSPGEVMVVSLAPIGLIVVASLLLLAKRTLPLTRVDMGGEPSSKSPDPVLIPIRVMACGVIPVLFSQAVMFVPTTIATFFPESEFSHIVSQYLSIPSLTYFSLFGAIIVCFTYLFAAVIYDPKDLIIRIRRYGYTIAGMESDKEAAEYVDTILLRTVWLGAAFLIMLAMLPTVMFFKFGVSELTFFNYNILVLSAIWISATQNISSQTNRGQWLTVFSGETIVEGELVKEILHDANIEARVFSSRVVPVLGTFAIWEVCRPKYPSIMIHRRLGKGSVDVVVSKSQLEEALEVLTSRRIL
jgi:preprotein translocase subunit SecY